MKRHYRFVEQSGTAACVVEDGRILDVPIFAGILKHPTTDDLAELLTQAPVVRKYTHEALRKAPWTALRAFPHWWLVACLPNVRLRDGRRRALEFMLRLDCLNGEQVS